MSEFTSTIEVDCNDEGILYAPFNIDGQTITELGMYNINFGSVKLKLWVVPKTKPEKLADLHIKAKRWVIRSNFDDARDEIYFTGFDIKTMSDEEGNEEIGEAVKGLVSKHQARIYTDYDKAYQAFHVLKVINYDAKWIILEVEC